MKRNGEAKRSGAEGLPAGVVARVFSVPSGKSASAEGNGGARVVFKVIDAITPVMDAESETNKETEKQLRDSLGDDVLRQYLARLQLDTGVTINEAVARVATGGAADQN